MAHPPELRCRRTHFDIDVNGKRHTHTGMATNMHEIIDLKPKKLHKIKIRHVAQISGGRDAMTKNLNGQKFWKLQLVNV